MKNTKVLLMFCICCLLLSLLVACDMGGTSASINNHQEMQKNECEHSWENATCTTPKTCGICKTTEGDELGHTIVIDEAIASTCTEEGKTEGSHCSVCDAVIKTQEVAPMADHTVVIDEAIASTCTKEGKTEGSHCAVCNTVIKVQEVAPMAAHTVVIDKAIASTCTKEGKTEGSHCAVCNVVIKEQVVVPMANHTVVIDKAIEATCSEEGKSEGSHCSVCKTVIKEQNTVPPTHNAPHGICLECSQVVDSDEAINYYVDIKTNAFDYYFSTYYNGSVNSKYSLNKAYTNLYFTNGYDGALYLTGSIDFSARVEESGDLFNGTGFLNYSIKKNGNNMDDGTCIISGNSKGTATVNIFEWIYAYDLEPMEFIIYFEDYYM